MAPPERTDIILLSHNRLDHLAATVDALEERTPEPIRITVVDNASGPAVRNWLAVNRHRFANVILRPTNEHVPAFQHGIDATTSDPYIVSDPDIVVPDLQPSWLARLHGLMERHPDFGLIGVGLDPVNRPAVLGPEIIDAGAVVDDEIVEAGVGTVMQMIRRRALVTPYRSDWRTCTDVSRAGWRVGWAKDIRAVHLGWDDYRLYPAHLASKHLSYGDYKEVSLIPRPPTLAALALAAPVLSVTRAAAVPDASVLELTWARPAVAAAVPAAVCVEAPGPGALPFEDCSAGAVVLVDPPANRAAELVAEAARVAACAVVAVATLAAFDARSAASLAPPGWSGSEAPGVGDIPFALAQFADRDAAMGEGLGFTTLEDRERWLAFFAESAFGAGVRRLWIWRRDERADVPPAVRLDATLARPWQPTPATPATPAALSPLGKLWRRADLVERARLRIAVRRARSNNGPA